MCEKERSMSSREIVRELAEKIERGEQPPTAREVARKGGFHKKQARVLISRASALVEKNKTEQTITELKDKESEIQTQLQELNTQLDKLQQDNIKLEKANTEITCEEVTLWERIWLGRWRI